MKKRKTLIILGLYLNAFLFLFSVFIIWKGALWIDAAERIVGDCVAEAESIKFNKASYEFLIFEENISAAEVIIANISAIEHVGGGSSELVSKILLWDWKKLKYHMNEAFLMLADYSFVDIPGDDFSSAKARFYELYGRDYQKLSPQEKEEAILDLSFIIDLIGDNKNPPKKEIFIDINDSLKS